jgi:hypothetical protein
MLENLNLTQTEAIFKAGLYLGRGHSTLDTLVSHWNKYKEVYVESGFRGGSVDQRSTGLYTTLPYFIITTIMNRHAAGVNTTVKDIQQAIADTHGAHISYWPIYYLMHDKMKLSYGLLKDATNLTKDPNLLKRIGQLLIKYASALKLEKKKKQLYVTWTNRMLLLVIVVIMVGLQIMKIEIFVLVLELGRDLYWFMPLLMMVFFRRPEIQIIKQSQLN